MFVLKPVEITRRHLTKQVGAGELEGKQKEGTVFIRSLGQKELSEYSN